MRVLVMVKATTKSEAGIRPGNPDFDTLLEQVGKFNMGRTR